MRHADYLYSSIFVKNTVGFFFKNPSFLSLSFVKQTTHRKKNQSENPAPEKRKCQLKTNPSRPNQN
jgi:hypothetical protein